MGILLGAGPVTAQAPAPQWRGLSGWIVQSSSSDLASGADIQLQPPADTKGIINGWAVLDLDASAYRHRRVQVSAAIAAEPLGHGAWTAMYLKVRRQGHGVRFASTESAGRVTGQELRQIAIDVPADATGFEIGIATQLRAGDTARLQRIQLAARAMPPISATQMVDAALSRVHQYAYYAARIDWPSLEPELRQKASRLDDATDSYPLIQRLLAALGDRHSRLLMPADQAAPVNHGHSQIAIRARLLDPGIAYIAVPGYEGTGLDAGRAFAAQLSSALMSLASSADRGWIVDLRGNSGGNMYPMLAGLYPLLGDAKLGAFRSRDGIDSPIQGLDAWRPLDAKAVASGAAVAVLIGPHTSSSGEITALAFIGRANTRWCGQPTDGRTSANRPFPLPDGSGLNLATSLDVDRLGQVHSGPIQPEVLIPTASNSTDADLAAAVQWLSSKPE